MRWLIIGGILALVVTVYALVDLTVTDDRRIRRLNRVLWVVLIVVLPVIGPAAWLTWGKGPRSQARPFAPDDDPSFSKSPDVTDEEADRRIAELEAQLAALDGEDFSAEPDRPVRPDAAKPEASGKPEAAEKSETGAKPEGTAKPEGASEPGGAAKPERGAAPKERGAAPKPERGTAPKERGAAPKPERGATPKAPVQPKPKRNPGESELKDPKGDVDGQGHRAPGDGDSARA